MKVGANGYERLEGYREYLRLLARVHLASGMPTRMDASDLVQETLLKAYQALERFQWKSEGELAAWLRAILVNTLRDGVRRDSADVRDQSREQSLELQIEQSSARLEALLAQPGAGPADGVDRQEQLLALAHALAKLPDDQRNALEMKHLQGLTVAEVGEQMGKSRAAVAGLLRRGLERLRELLDAP